MTTIVIDDYKTNKKFLDNDDAHADNDWIHSSLCLLRVI